MAALYVEDLLARAEEREAETRRSVAVHKELELEFDAGNLLAVDRNPVGRAVVAREALLRTLARDNTQLLVGQLWGLPSERAEGGAGPVVAKLPEPSTRLPREKPLPKARPLTRWEQFARLKGIRPTRKKRGTLVWDEAAKEWRRRWGYRRAGPNPSRDWLLEVPEGADPLEDQFARRRREKRERVARNELSRLRNLARAHRGAAANELHPTGRQDRAELGRVSAVARLSTASRGRFQPRLPKEPPAPKSAGPGGRKRRFGPVLGDLEGEKKRQLELARSLSAKKPPLDLTRAVNKQLRQDEAEAAAAAKGKKRGQRGKRARRQQRRPGGKKSGGAARRGSQGSSGSVGGKRKKK
ncbi:ribosome biogenesis regulatory protein homolog [Eublepharis macularius]|uniref:Ribosome biogenesis regulatory protein n=1 Tax=Eublepharis macularius TaxID=481883 RepID=A0AA97L413_EUBMA|nr:ribosome biogenesis regulatory protein homolog [Eublepharis macularius]